MTSERCSRSKGITLIESLVAIAIIGFGLLVLTRLQMNLTRNASEAAHRVEATRLAQQKLEEMRSLQDSASSGESGSNWDSLESGEDKTRGLGNAHYARTWTIGGSASAAHRTVVVKVRWTDSSHAKADQPVVVLATVLAAQSTEDAGHLALPPEGGFIRLVERRHASVPLDAFKLRGVNKGFSALKDPTADHVQWIIDDANGVITSLCEARPDDTISIKSSCTPRYEALLQGYIESADSANANAIRFNSAASKEEPTKCEVTRVTGAEGRAVLNRYRFRCHVAMTRDAQSLVKPRSWEGRLSFPTLSVGVLACRYADDGVPTSYTGVTSSLDNQNFILTAEHACPSGTEQQSDA